MTLNSLGFDVLSNKMIHFKHILDHPCFTAEQPSIEESSFYTEICSTLQEDAHAYTKTFFALLSCTGFSIANLLFNQNFT